MPELYKNKYRVESTRLKGWDYSQNAYYFVTICTKNREEFLSEIINGRMVLSEIGKIVLDEWLKTEIMRPNVILDERVLMPNHLHGILGICNDDPTMNIEINLDRNEIIYHQ